MTKNPPSVFNWQDVDTVLLDMDGTLIDRYFDDHFWNQHVPKKYAVRHHLSLDDANAILHRKYKAVENTLDWADVDYWTAQLELDIPQLKREINNLIQVHPHTQDFLNYVKNSLGKKLYLVTNAHPKTLEVKMEKAAIGHHFDQIISSNEIGAAKEQLQFWQRLEKFLNYDPSTTMLADDNHKVLDIAKEHGIQYMIYMAQPSSRLAPKPSPVYPSINFFDELIF